MVQFECKIGNSIACPPSISKYLLIIYPSSSSKRRPKSPAQYSSTPCSDNPKFMPDLGEHSREILLENGFSDEKIREFSENQIIAVR